MGGTLKSSGNDPLDPEGLSVTTMTLSFTGPFSPRGEQEREVGDGGNSGTKKLALKIQGNRVGAMAEISRFSLSKSLGFKWVT